MRAGREYRRQKHEVCPKPLCIPDFTQRMHWHTQDLRWAGSLSSVDAIGAPIAWPCKQQNMPALTAYPLYLSEQRKAFASWRLVVAEDYARPRWKFSHRRLQPVTQPRIGHQPDFGQKALLVWLAVRHHRRYSPPL